MSTNLSIFEYEGQSISFNFNEGDIMINLTEVAKAFPSKNLAHIVNSQEIREYVEKFSEIQNCISADLLIVRKGGNPKEQGTWAHQKVALRVAQKLSTEFAIWVDEKIETLLTTGTVHLQAKSISRADLARMVLESEKEKDQLVLELDRKESFMLAQESEIKRLAPMAAYANDVLVSKSGFTATQIAKEFGMSAKQLNKLLNSLRIQYKRGGQWVLYSAYQDKGYTFTNTYINDKEDESSMSKNTWHSTVWTESGRKFIYDTLRDKLGITH